MADEYTKGIELEFTSNIDEIIKQLQGVKDMSKKMDMNFSKSGKSIPEWQRSDFALFKDAVERFGKGTTKFQQSASGIMNWVNSTLDTSMSADFSISGLINSIIGVFKSAWAELEEMVNYSLMSDSKIRNLKLTYGLDSSSAYGVSNAAEIMGISSLEDALWMNSDQLELFTDVSKDFSDMYESYMNDPEFAKSIYTLDIELEKFKVEILKPIMELIVANKDKIIGFVNWFSDGGADMIVDTLVSIAQGIVDLLKWLGFIEDEDKKPVQELDSYKQATELATSTNGTYGSGLDPNASHSSDKYVDLGKDSEVINTAAMISGAASQNNNSIVVNLDGKQIVNEQSSGNQSKTIDYSIPRQSMMIVN